MRAANKLAKDDDKVARQEERAEAAQVRAAKVLARLQAQQAKAEERVAQQQQKTEATAKKAEANAQLRAAKMEARAAKVTKLPKPVPAAETFTLEETFDQPAPTPLMEALRESAKLVDEKKPVKVRLPTTEPKKPKEVTVPEKRSDKPVNHSIDLKTANEQSRYTFKRTSINDEDAATAAEKLETFPGKGDKKRASVYAQAIMERSAAKRDKIMDMAAAKDAPKDIAFTTELETLRATGLGQLKRTSDFEGFLAELKRNFPQHEAFINKHLTPAWGATIWKRG